MYLYNLKVKFGLVVLVDDLDIVTDYYENRLVN